MKLLKNLVNVLFSLALLSGASGAPAVEKVVYFHNDALGSPVAATNEQGQLLWTETYEPYGKRVVNPASDNKLWYTGKPEDTEFGLNYFGARWYDPLIGRFQGIDPIAFREGNVQSFNSYAYANNNPYKYIDPDGRDALDGVSRYMAELQGKDMAEWDRANAEMGRLTLGILGVAAVGIATEGLLGPAAAATLELAATGGEAPPVTKIKIEKGLTRNSPNQIKTDLSSDETIKNLEANGFTKKSFQAQNGGTGYVLTNNEGKTYRFYPNATSGGGAAAEVLKYGTTLSKLRLETNL